MVWLGMKRGDVAEALQLLHQPAAVQREASRITIHCSHLAAREEGIGGDSLAILSIVVLW